jgi:hypothetical protein
VFVYGQLALTDPNSIFLGIFVFALAWPITALSGIAALKGYWAAVPAGFMGAAVFFGIHFYGNAGAVGPNPSVLNSAIAGLIPLVAGLVLGFLSLAITNVLAAEKPAPVASPHPA